jgi:hypothetical protein
VPGVCILAIPLAQTKAINLICLPVFCPFFAGKQIIHPLVNSVNDICGYCVDNFYKIVDKKRIFRKYQKSA